MPWHPVPRRAFWLYLQYRLLMTCSRLISFALLLGNCVILGILFWLHQGRIPRHTCRFYCCLAAHQRTRKKDSAEPSFPILWTPPHPPGESAAAGHICCRGFGTILESGIRCRSIIPTSIFRLAALCSGLDCSRFSRFRWAGIVRFSLVVG